MSPPWFPEKKESARKDEVMRLWEKSPRYSTLDEWVPTHTHGWVLPLQTSVACMIVGEEMAEQGVCPSCSHSCRCDVVCSLSANTWVGVGQLVYKATIRGCSWRSKERSWR